ncbi:MAG TPA: phospholipase D-like domain-containing protein [Candidatus Acidoferrales bacterium]|nr:phospholipase D-like domain-containing protein [Candidatus Acidoferrales bacterium]
MIAVPPRPAVKPARVWLLAAVVLATMLVAVSASAAQIEACFSPPLPGGCDPAAAVVQAIGGARKTVLVQMYALTSRRIVSALVNAKRRGVDVRAIVDRRQLDEDRSDTNAVARLASGGVPVLVDTVPGLMHNKIMIVDGATVITGSFNYTWSAEHRNAENLLVIHDATLAAEYTQNWNIHAAKSRPLAASMEGAAPSAQAAPNAVAGPIVGNRHSMIYEWSGCPYYGKIAPSNQASFPNAQAAEAAGYRPAKNCP